MAVHAR